MRDPWVQHGVFAADGKAVVLAADHRARGVLTVESYADYLSGLTAAADHVDAVMASAQPLEDLVRGGHVRGGAILSINRTGLAGTAFELRDELVASCVRAAQDGYSGVKIMTRIDRSDPESARQLELLGVVLEEARELALTCLVEPLVWTGTAMSRSVDDIIWACTIAHDMGAPLIKAPIPSGGPDRVAQVARVVASVGVPVLFLGGPRSPDRKALLQELSDAMAGGAAGFAIGRAVYQDPDPAFVARLVGDLVHARRSSDEVLAALTEVS